MFNKQRGVTLVELIITIVILSIALVGLSLAISSGLGQSSNTLFELRAAALGQAYLDEILSKKFDERSRNSGIPPCVDPMLPGRACSNPLVTEEGSRTRYDDVDDYDGLDEGLNAVGGPRPLRDADGNLRVGYDNFRVQVAVRRIAVGVGQAEEFPSVNAATNPKPDDIYDAKLITVTVSNGAATGLQFSAYKSNF
jgi:MSHA pilin protein MshD